MRIRTLIKMYNNKLEIYSDETIDFTFDIIHNKVAKTIIYHKDDDKFKAILILHDGDVIHISGLINSYVFIKTDNTKWIVHGTIKDKILKNNKKYLLAITPGSAINGLFHNIQKQIKLESDL